MAFFRISELPTAVVPAPAGALLEISEPDATTISGFDSRRITVSEFFTDAVFTGNIIVPTAPPLSNNSLVASTAYVDAADTVVYNNSKAYTDAAVGNTTGYIDTNFLKLSGGTLSGPLQINSTLSVSGAAGVGGGLTVGGALTVAGAANLNGYVTAADLRSNGNVYVPSGWGFFGGYLAANGNIDAGGAFFTHSTGDAGPSTSAAQISGRKWRFLQNGGDEGNAGSLDYRVSDSGCLNITGAGTSGVGRRVKIFDNLDTNQDLNVGNGLTVNGNAHVNGTASFTGPLDAYAALTVRRPSSGSGPGAFTEVGTTYDNGSGYVWKTGAYGDPWSGTSYPYSYFVSVGGTPKLVVNTDGACFNSTGSWTALSSRELKEQIQPYERGMDALRNLNPVSFQYSAGTPFATTDEPSPTRYGLIAEDVQPHVPEVCGEATVVIEGQERVVQTLHAGNLLYAILNAVKELDARLAVLEENE